MSYSDKISRKQFLSLALGSMINFGCSPFSKRDQDFDNSKSLGSPLLITQLRDLRTKEFSLLFFNLSNRESTVLPIPYRIHAVLPIKGNSEFLLTSKGGYVFHVNSKRIISSWKSPDHFMFYGHSAFFEESNTFLTSTIDCKDYDFVPRRRAKRMHQKDESFGFGYLFEYELSSMKLKDKYPTGAFFPHDLRVYGEREVVVLNASNRSSGLNGTLTTFDPINKVVSNSVRCSQDNDVCPMSHFYGPKERGIILGVSNRPNLIFYNGGELRASQRMKQKLNFNYETSEMLNGAFDYSKDRVGIINIDNGHLSLWDYKTGKVVKHFVAKKLITINFYDNRYFAFFQEELKIFNRDLDLIESQPLSSLGLKGLQIFGPHSVLV